jgi:hypothetical protein
LVFGSKNLNLWRETWDGTGTGEEELKNEERVNKREH